jgi:hypothetical protein
MRKDSTLVRTLVGLVVAVLLLLASWGAVHRVRGGAELPPPKWSEADLVPLPPDAENAWGVIGPLAKMPDFTIDPALWDDSVPIPEEARAAVDAELARPEVRALLARVPAVLERAYLSPPDTLADPLDGDIRTQQWRLWLGLSLNRTLDTDPESAALVLSKLFPMWIQCANSARDPITFVMCADGAKRDLDLMSRTAESALRTRDARSLELLRSATDKTPAISSDNLMVARYIFEYRSLRSVTSEINGFLVDFRETLDTLNAYFAPDQMEALCATREDTRTHPFYLYNGFGKRAASTVAGFHCEFLPYISNAINAVTERRAKLQTTLPKN